MKKSKISKPLNILLKQTKQLTGLLHSQEVMLESEKDPNKQQKLKEAISTTRSKIENLESQIKEKQAT